MSKTTFFSIIVQQMHQQCDREFRSYKKYRILNRGLFATFFYACFCQILCICLSYFIVFCDIILKGECYACYFY